MKGKLGNWSERLSLARVVGNTTDAQEEDEGDDDDEEDSDDEEEEESAEDEVEVASASARASQAESRAQAEKVEHRRALREYSRMVYDSTPDGTIGADAKVWLSAFCRKRGISAAEHANVLDELGWTVSEYDSGVKESRRTEVEEEKRAQQEALERVRKERATTREV